MISINLLEKSTLKKKKKLQRIATNVLLTIIRQVLGSTPQYADILQHFPKKRSLFTIQFLKQKL